MSAKPPHLLLVEALFYEHIAADLRRGAERAAGEAGVTMVLNILQHEFQVAMALTGRPNVASIDRSVIWS